MLVSTIYTFYPLLILILSLPIALTVDVVISTVVVSTVVVSDEFIIRKGMTAAARVINVIVNVKVLLQIFFTFSFLSKK